MRKKVFFAMLNRVKKSLTRNIVLKLVSVFFAMILWAYVLSAENPVRIKTIPNVTVSFDGEADLIARKFVVRGNRAEILKEASISIKTDVTNYADINSMNVSATVNLRNISDVGVYELPISAYTSTGTVDSISPRTIRVEIDNLVTKKIPVQVVVEGSVAEGYWADEPRLSREEIEIEGAATDVDSVVKAICYVNADEKSESFYRSFNVMLLDENNNEVEASHFLGEIPSVTVRMSILPKKTVKINLEDSIFGIENIPTNYELLSVKPLVDEITIVGDHELIDSINELKTESINVSGMTESAINSYLLELPDGIQVVGGNSISVYIDIREKEIEKTFNNVTVHIEGLDKKLRATISTRQTDITLKGRISLLSQIELSEIKLYIDLTGLASGIHTCEINCKFANEDVQSEIIYTLGVTEVQVTIR